MLILLIEDHDDTRLAMKTLLGLSGHDVVDAEDGGQAIAALEARVAQDLPPFDCAVVDLGLPDTTGTELMRELLNAMDSFDLAIRNAGKEKSAGDNMLRGLDLVYKQFQDTLGRFGLKTIEAEGQPFDPNFHQAVTTVPTDEVEENTVVDELRRGYTLNGRLLRPAMVSVSKSGEGAED